jgi:hypothetical protein
MTSARKIVVVISLLLAITTIVFFAYSNSDQLSTHHATLKCNFDAKSENAPTLTTPFIVQLRYDWIKGTLYRYSPNAKAEGGAYKWKMVEKSDLYYGREYGGGDTAVFELRRDDLKVTLTFLNYMGNTKFWLSGTCEIVDPEVFTTARNDALREQLENQKI